MVETPRKYYRSLDYYYEIPQNLDGADGTALIEKMEMTKEEIRDAVDELISQREEGKWPQPITIDNVDRSYRIYSYTSS